MAYNATVYRETADGQPLSTFVAEVTPDGVMLCSNAVQCTGLEGSPAYDEYVRANAFAGYTLRIVQDGTAGYRNRLAGLAIPPTYRRIDR